MTTKTRVMLTITWHQKTLKQITVPYYLDINNHIIYSDFFNKQLYNITNYLYFSLLHVRVGTRTRGF